MFYSESLPKSDSNFSINSASNFDSFSESNSESGDSKSDLSSVFIILDNCIFSPYIYILLQINLRMIFL